MGVARTTDGVVGWELAETHVVLNNTELRTHVHHTRRRRPLEKSRWGGQRENHVFQNSLLQVEEEEDQRENGVSGKREGPKEKRNEPGNKSNLEGQGQKEEIVPNTDKDAREEAQPDVKEEPEPVSRSLNQRPDSEEKHLQKRPQESETYCTATRAKAKC